MSVGLFGFVLGAPGAALAANLPSGAQVVIGDISLQQGANSLRIAQESNAAIVNWQSFNIGHGALVDVIQPSVDAALLSRVVGGSLSDDRLEHADHQQRRRVLDARRLTREEVRDEGADQDGKDQVDQCRLAAMRGAGHVCLRCASGPTARTCEGGRDAGAWPAKPLFASGRSLETFGFTCAVRS